MARRLAVIGAGKMGSTLLRALLDGGAIEPADVVATVRHAENASELGSRLGIEATTDNRAAAAGAEVVLVEVKPQGLAEVLEELAPALSEDQLVVSIVASATTGSA